MWEVTNKCNKNCSYCGANLKKNYNIVNDELKNYKANLNKKPQIIVISKSDITACEHNIKKLKKALMPLEAIEISSHTGKNIEILCSKIASELLKIEKIL